MGSVVGFHEGPRRGRDSAIVARASIFQTRRRCCYHLMAGPCLVRGEKEKSYVDNGGCWFVATVVIFVEGQWANELVCRGFLGGFLMISVSAGLEIFVCE